MAEKFLETAEMEQLRKEITMTKLGQMIYNDGKDEGSQERLMILVKKKLAKGLSVEDIADAVEEDIETVEKLIAEIEAK